MTPETAADPVCTESPETAAGDVCTGPLPTAALGGPVSLAVSRVARLHRMAAGKLLRGAGLYP